MLFEGDLIREETPKILLAGTYHFNDRAQRERGQLGKSLFELRYLTSVHLDAMLKYNGWAFQTAYLIRSTDNPITVNPSDPTDFRYVFSGSGLNFQMSYLVVSNFELIGRYSTQAPDREVRVQFPQVDQYSFGITRNIWEHALKIPSELTYSENTFP